MGYAPSSVDMSLTKQIENAVAAGRQFYVNTGAYAVTTNGPYAGISVFFTARATKIVLVGARGYDQSTTQTTQVRKTTSDPNLSGHAISGVAIVNAMGSGGAATSGGNLTSSTEAISGATGTLHRSTRVNINTGVAASEILQKPSDYIVIPPNIAGGFLLITNGANTETVIQELVWVEI